MAFFFLNFSLSPAQATSLWHRHSCLCHRANTTDFFPTQLATASSLSFTSARQSQTPQSTSSQSKSQKVKNPLNDLLEEAQTALDKNDYTSAIPPLQKFLAEQPDVAYAHFQLAYAYTGLHEDDNARAEYEKAATLDPKMAEAHLNLGILLLEKNPAGAVTSLRKAVALLPSQSRPRFLLGLALERSDDISGAAEAFAAAWTLDPSDTEAALHLANADLQLKKPVDAEKKFRDVLAREPKSPQALRGLALSLDAQSKPEALDAYRGYLALQPNDAVAKKRLVQLLVANKQFDEALAVSGASVGQSATLDDLKLRADIQIGQNKLDDADKTLQQAIALAPQDPQLHGGLGRLHLQQRKFPEAERELKIAIQLDQKNVTYWKDLASTFYLAENYSAALSTYDVVDKFESPGAGVWFIRALCYDKLDQVQPALDAYRKFLDLDNNQHANQVWQANQRIHVLEKRADKKK
jgi:Flp pilus assembly protein TadD